jgi:hypothetical protein
MPTTLTIDDRLAKELRKIARLTGKSFKQVVNETLKAGLEPSTHHVNTRPYRLKPVSMGKVAAEYDLDRALHIADRLEDKELSSKLAN